MSNQRPADSDATTANPAIDADATTTGSSAANTSGQDLAALQGKLREFVSARDWQQFHSPKNLSMALIAECAEVIEHFQWMSESDSRTLTADQRLAVQHELADVFIYTLMLAEQLKIDLVSAAHTKVALNDQKYPADKVRGDARRGAQYPV